ncbi:MAG: carbohydrate binding domain-containing protein [Clostridia bacterium]|nr:carbohydrate binding domain-containing protein [Clostridia bacterium]
MKRFRKLTAVLLAAVLLCGLLPIHPAVTAAGPNLIKNGDFESGDTGWTKLVDTIQVVDDPTGAGQGKVMQTDEAGSGVHMFQQGVTMTANTDYLLTFKVYTYAASGTKPGWWVTLGDTSVTYSTSNVTAGGVEVKTVDSSSSTRVRFTVTSTSLYNTWVEVSIPFNSGNNTAPNIMFSNYRSNAGQYYFDDIVLVDPNGTDEGGDEGDSDLTDAPEGYNMLKNGDFAKGGTHWTMVNTTTIATTVVEDPTAAGQGLLMKTDANNTTDGGSGNEMFYQSVSSMSANTDYILSFKVYVYSTAEKTPGFWVTLGTNAITYSTSNVTGGLSVKTVDSSSSTRVRFTASSSSNRNVWYTIQIPFNSGDISSTTITFSNYRANAGQYYFDDVTLVRADGKIEPGLEEPEEPDTPDTPADGNLVINGDFETGDTTGWTANQSTTVNAEAAKNGNYGAYLSGKGSYGSLLHTNAEVAIGKSYLVKVWLKVVSVGVNVQVKADNDNGVTLGSKWCAAAGYAEWTLVSLVVTPTTNSLFINFCGAGEGSYEVAYIDDVVVTEAPLISNGDFEVGDLSGWERHQSTVISADAAYEGGYGVHLKGNGSWGGMLNQNIAVKSGNTYEISLWYKINANGFTLQLQGVQSGTMYMNKSYKSPVGEWTQLTVTVAPSGDNTIKVNFSGVGGSSAANASLAEDVYVDSITVTELKGASNDGYILNGDFEYRDWTTHWTNVNGACTVALVEGHNSAQALSITAPKWTQVRQKFTVEANTDYTLTLWAKDTTDISLMFKTGSNDQNYLQKNISAGSTWTEITYDFNSGDNTSLYLGFMGQESGYGAAIIDDVRIVAVKDPSFDGYVYNGDFESGSLVKWTTSSACSTYLATDSHGGIYSAAVKGPGDWGGGLLTQEITVEAGKTYTLSFWYKPITNGVNYKLRTTDGATGFDAQYLDSRKVADWTYYEFTFEVGLATEIELTFSGSGKGSTDEVLIDDVRLVNLSGNEMDRNPVLEKGGSSISDEVQGLAFLFHLDVTGAGVAEGTHQMVNNQGTIKLYKYAEVYGTLVRAGAIMTNNATVGATAFTAADVNGQNVIDVNAKYLFEVGEDSISYAVRIVNIPNAGLSKEVYARPYFVYELEGEQVTIYGDVVSNSYTGVESTRRTKRVLTVGGDYEDTDDHLYNVLESADYDQIILGHYADGTYYKNDDNGVWTTTADYDQALLMGDERWQYIVVNDATLLDWVNANKPTDARVMYNISYDNYAADVTAARSAAVDGVIATGSALKNLDTVAMDGLYDNGALTDKGDYAASLTWFVALTGESLDLVDYIPDAIGADRYDMARAAAHAYIIPYEVSDLTETVLIAGSDFQPNTNDKGVQNIRDVMGALNDAGHYAFDGLLFTGDYTQALGSDHDSGVLGQAALDSEMHNYVNFDRIYGQGNHDAATIQALSPYGNNDPLYAPYGVFNIPEDKYTAYGGGGQQVAADLTAYFNEKLADPTWGNKPIFVLSHLPLHYNYRTMKDKGGSSAMYLVDAMNAASEAGLNIIFLFGHNHSGGYDDYLGGAAIYIPKGESILVTDPANYENAPINTQLKFTYMNSGYIGYYNDMGNGADTALTMSVFRIQADGDVVITRYSKNGVHNLKSAGQLSPYDRDYTTYTQADARVYASSRVVSADSDSAYED